MLLLLNDKDQQSVNSDKLCVVCEFTLCCIRILLFYLYVLWSRLGGVQSSANYLLWMLDSYNYSHYVVQYISVTSGFYHLRAKIGSLRGVHRPESNLSLFFCLDVWDCWCMWHEGYTHDAVEKVKSTKLRVRNWWFYSICE